MKPKSSSVLTLLIGLLALGSLTACFQLKGEISNAQQSNPKLNSKPKSNASPVSLLLEKQNNRKQELGSELLPIAFYLNSRKVTADARPWSQK